MAQVRCDQCEASMINGVFCHETGCSNKNWKPPTARKSYNPSRVQRGWDKLDSVMKYLIWMCSSEIYTGKCRDLILNLRTEYILDHSGESYDIHASNERNSKWRAMYERQIKNGRGL